MGIGARLSAAVTLAALMFGGGCHDMSAEPSAPSAVADSHWRAEDVDGRGVVDEAAPTVAFQGTERIAGTTGCNRYFGQVTVVGDSFSAGAIAATRRGCPPPLMEQEQRFTEALAAARRYTLEEPYLLLFDAAGTERLRLVRDPGAG